MDFSSLLSKEIAKRKHTVEALEKGSKKKYIRQIDLEKEKEKEYEKKLEEARRKRQEQIDEITKERKQRKTREKQERDDRTKEYEESGHKDSELEEESVDKTETKYTKEEQELLDSITEEELSHQLKDLGQPVILEEENKLIRIKRLKKIQLKQHLLEKQKEDQEREASLDFNIVPEDIRDDENKVYSQVRAYLKHLIFEWEADLKARDETPERAFDILTETKQYLVPLLSLLRRRKLSPQIFPTLSTLCMYLQQRNYRNANNTYLKLSIGNAAWPIGVTAVGIHARSARERITGDNQSSTQIAHIMSDETTRKWLTSVKRLITFCEGHWQA